MPGTCSPPDDPKPVSRTSANLSIPVKPELVLVDLDGTLVDSAPDLTVCVDAVLARLDRPPCGETGVRRWVGNGVDRLLHRALTGDMDSTADADLFSRARKEFLRLYECHNGRHSRIYPGVVEGLDFLTGLGCRMGCVTNKPACFTEPLLHRFGLDRYFTLILSGDSLPARKPDPLPLRHAARYFDVAPGDSLLIGDSINDIRAARAAGFRIVCVSYGYNHGEDICHAGADAVVDSLAELAGLLADDK